MGLGAGAGVAGVAAIAAVAISQLVKHAGDLADIFQSWQGGRPAEVLRGIREEAEAAAAALEKVSKFTSEEERRAGKVGKFVQDEQKDRFVSEIMDAMGRNEKHVAAYKKAAMHAGDIGRIKGLEGKEEHDLREIQAEEWAMQTEEFYRREAAEKLAGKALLPGAVGHRALGDLQSMFPERAEKFQNLARGVDPAEVGQKARATDAAAKTAQDKDEAAMRKRVMDEAEAKKKVRDDQKKADADERRAWLHDINTIHKEKRLQGLEEERASVLKNQRDFDEKMWQKQQENASGQIFSGAKSFIDYYSGAGTGGDDPKAIAKAAHEQRRITNEKLEAINKKLDQTRKVIIPN